MTVQDIKGGYILLPRKIVDSELWCRKPDAWIKIFQYIILTVPWDPLHSQKYGIGSAYFDSASCNFVDISKGQWSRCIAYLREAGTISTKRSGRGMIITVINYELYQDATNYRKSERPADPDKPDKSRKRKVEKKKPNAPPDPGSRESAETDAVDALVRAAGDKKEFARVLSRLSDKYKDFGKKNGLTVAAAAKDIFDFSQQQNN